MRRVAFLVCLVWLACAHTPEPPPAAPAPASAPASAPVATPAPVPRPIAAPPLAADTPTTTAAGNPFTAPAGWTLEADAQRVTITPTEKDLHVVIVDAPGGEPDAAVAAAWASFRPGVTRTPKLVSPEPGRNGWDEGRSYEYETSPNEKLAVAAGALRHGTAWTVLLFEGSEATFERRAAQVGLIAQSLRPKGYDRESFAGKKAHPLDAARIQLLEDFIVESQKQLGIPGVALGLIDGGKVVFAGGLGVRALGRPEKVDADTLFIIASNTKQLTTLMLAKLVEAGKLRWDEPVTEALPGFKLGDAATTSQVLVKHLICACTGMPRQDLEWLFEYGSATPESEMTILGNQQPTSKFGEVFQYSNLMAAAGGYVGGHVLFPDKKLGPAYDEAMRTLVFQPLGMSSTTFDFARAQRGNHALPHSDDIDGKTHIAPMNINYAVVPLRPAGGAWSNVRDLLRYVQMELERGKLPDGKPYISEGNLLARRAPQIQLGEDRSYAMALMIDRSKGVTVVRHGGDLVGYHSDLVWLPDHGIGMVILTNGDLGGALRGAVLRRLLELVFDGKPEAVENVASIAKDYHASLAKERERLVVPADAAAAAQLARRYSNPLLGSVVVKKKGAATIFDFGEWASQVASRKNDDGTMSFVPIDPGYEAVQMVVGTRDGKKVLIVRDAQHEYVFTEG